MMTRDFAERARKRIAEARTGLTKLREVYKETIRQLTKLNKQLIADRDRLYERLEELAYDVVEKLPEKATEGDVEHANVIKEDIFSLAAELEEISLAGSVLEDLSTELEAPKEIFASLKESEARVALMEHHGAKLGI